MPPVETQTLEACLEHAARHIRNIQELDLSEEGDLYQALELSKEVLGTLAMCRGLLKRLEAHALWSHRYAA